jgi:cell division protein FtsN
MTRDYAKKPRSTGRSQGRSSSAPPPRKPLPPWLWLLAGLTVGLFVAFLVYLKQPGQPVAKAPVAREAARPAAKPVAKPAPQPAPKPEPKPAEGPPKLSYDFYKILPEYEVVIPEEDLKKPEVVGAPATRFVVQAGSFRSSGDAERRKAELALLGLVAKVQTVTVDGKDTWHRVQLGPYQGVREVDRARRLLQDNNVSFIVVRQPG